MDKNINIQFDSWNIIKKKVNSKKIAPQFKEREIYFGRIGFNIGYEQNGKGEEFLRPILVYKKFNNQVFLEIPLTKTPKKTKYYFQFSFIKGQLSTAILSQIRLMDSKRLERKIGSISIPDSIKLKKAICNLIC